jgi:hypothetical protein
MVPVFPGQSQFYEIYVTMSWCPAKLGIGHQLSQGCPSRKNTTFLTMPKKVCDFPIVGESAYSSRSASEMKERGMVRKVCRMVITDSLDWDANDGERICEEKSVRELSVWVRAVLLL